MAKTEKKEEKAKQPQDNKKSLRYELILELISTAIEEAAKYPGYEDIHDLYLEIFKRLIKNKTTKKDIEYIKVLCLLGFDPNELLFTEQWRLIEELKELKHETYRRYRDKWEY